MRRSLCDVVYCLLWFVVGWSLSLFLVGVVVSLLMRVVGCCSFGVLCCLVSCLPWVVVCRSLYVVLFIVDRCLCLFVVH